MQDRFKYIKDTELKYHQSQKKRGKDGKFAL